MAIHTPIIGNDPSAGRLPAPKETLPISESAFTEMCRRWGRMGLYLSLWAKDGRCLASDDETDWSLLARNETFVRKLNNIARQTATTAEENDDTKTKVVSVFDRVVFGFAVPVVRHRRVCGTLLAVGLMSEATQEDVARMCQSIELPVQDGASIRESIPTIQSSQVDPISELIELSVEQFNSVDRKKEEVAILTNNLDDTYEELHLIYEISHFLGLPQRPNEMLARVAEQLVDATRAKTIAFVLKGHDYENAEDLIKACEDPRTLSEHVIVAGDAPTETRDMLKLTQSLSAEVEKQPKHILLNRASENATLSWAKPWLKHLVAYPLIQDGDYHGTLYTINCKDTGDYTSVDVQLFRAVADRLSAALHNQHLYDDLADLLMGMLHALVNSVDAKDPYTYGHSERVAFFSRALAQAAGLPKIECERIYLSGLLHDIGKIGVPDAVLTKPGRLTDEEFDQLKKHPEIGHRILSRVRQISDLVPGVLFHHERMDGKGYPYGLEGRSIPLFGRIICIADSFDAMTSNRTYRAALPLPMAVAEIRRCAGLQFDPALADVFLKFDIEKLFKEANEDTSGNADVSRIGALRRVEAAVRNPEAEITPAGVI